MRNADKKIMMSKKSVVKEHEKLVPELKKAGLKEEYCEQSKELKKLKKE